MPGGGAHSELAAKAELFAETDQGRESNKPWGTQGMQRAGPKNTCSEDAARAAAGD